MLFLIIVMCLDVVCLLPPDVVCIYVSSVCLSVCLVCLVIYLLMFHSCVTLIIHLPSKLVVFIFVFYLYY
jgi:hypothetical protein